MCEKSRLFSSWERMLTRKIFKIFSMPVITQEKKKNDIQSWILNKCMQMTNQKEKDADDWTASQEQRGNLPIQQNTRILIDN